MTDPVHHRLALAILKAARGDEAGTSVWERWTVAEREEAAEAVAPLLPILANTILGIKDAMA